MVESAVEDVCDRVLTRLDGRAEAVVAVTAGTAALTRFADGHIHQNVAEDERVVRLTVSLDGSTAHASGNRVDDEGVAGLVERALAAAALRPADPHAAGFAPPAPVADVDHWDDATATADPDDRAGVVAAFVAAGGAHGDAGEPTDGAAGYCSVRARRRALASSTGQRAAARSTLAVLDGIHRVALGSGADDRDHGFADGLAQQVAAGIGALDGAGCGALAAGKARAGAAPMDLEPGRYEVVLEPRAVAAALLFPAYAGFNGKAHADGTSFVRLGEAQWDESIDLWDDATDRRAVGDPFDAEGTPKARVDLVRAGVSVGLTHDRRSARLAEVEPTGHSVGSEAFGGYATDLFLGRGDRSPDELVAGVERGLLVTDLWYNRILDPRTQVVTGLTRNGLFLVERGEIVGAVQNLRYTQSIVGAFGPGRVRGIGDDARLVHQGGAGMVVPSVHLAEWAFTGNARG